MNWRKLHTNMHYWGASLIIIPFIIILCSGILLQVKNEFNWIQPKTEKIEKSNSNKLSLTLKQILQSAMSIQETKISSWKDIKDININPSKGITKLRTKDKWEIQIHNATGEILSVNYRRSDIIKSIHDGSFFSDIIKLWVFLPTAFILLVMSLTGTYMFFKILPQKNAKRKRKKEKNTLSS
ncbi:MAG: PepSY domain-containing protein [Campylobacteraceae bacterium]|nr:PepSY domain-containing protein [Campylobacteraceae bacterium]